MCVICIKTGGHALPSKKELKLMFERNSDGCGYVAEHSNYKSLDFEDFYEHLRRVPKDENCIIHFRWATHGSVKRKNCHPFYDAATNTFFAHNGVLSIHPHKDMTDSETAFRDILVPALKTYDIYSKDFAEVVHSIIGASKFAFMQNGQLRVFGRFLEHGGCYYSNLHHLATPFWRLQ